MACKISTLEKDQFLHKLEDKKLIFFIN